MQPIALCTARIAISCRSSFGRRLTHRLPSCPGAGNKSPRCLWLTLMCSGPVDHCAPFSPARQAPLDPGHEVTLVGSSGCCIWLHLKSQLKASWLGLACTVPRGLPLERVTRQGGGYRCRSAGCLLPAPARSSGGLSAPGDLNLRC